MRLKLLGAGLLIVVGIGAIVVVIVRPGAASTGNSQYLTAAVTQETVTSDIAANGTLSPVTRYGLDFGQPATVLASSSSSSSSSSAAGAGSSSATWPVTAVNVAVGAVVSKGDVLATADTSDLDYQISQAKNTLAAAGNQLAQAKSNLDAATTDAQLWQARSAYHNAENADAQAQKTLDDLKAQKALATITAPADGIVEAVNVIAGQDAPSGDAIVLDSGGLQAVIAVTETDLPNVKTGQQATVGITAVNASATGTVTAISPTANGGGSSVVTYGVTVGLNSTPESARAGMSVSVAITIAQATNAIAIPSIALLGQTGSYSVRVMDASGTVTDVPVQVGLITSNLTQITSGLTVGQRVVIGVNTAQNSTTTGGFGGLGGGLGGGTFRQVTGGGGFGR